MKQTKKYHIFDSPITDFVHINSLDVTVKNTRLLDILGWIIRRSTISTQNFNGTGKSLCFLLYLSVCYIRTFQTIELFYTYD
jgi:hypothetical protein